jgi:glycosyltransferase involved in cell wall biosynthesis
LAEDIIFKQLLERPSILVPKLCICARLEKMKGVHIAIEALLLLKQEYQLQPILIIFGHGEEREALESLSNELGVRDQVKFLGYVSYGKDFFEAIQTYDLMLMTNLSDEQPRLVFDAISQGLIPISPNTLVYKDVGLDDALLYRQASASDLAKKILLYTDKDLLVEEIRKSRKLLRKATIGQMHFHRNKWIQSLS